MLCSLIASAQGNRLYTIQQGLATCDINSLLVDSRGLLWIGGNSPVCFFGGRQFHYMDNHDPETHKTLYNYIKQIEQDEQEQDCYWLVTDGGLFYFDSRKQTYERIALSPEENDENYHPVRQIIDLNTKRHQKLVMTEGYGFYVLDSRKKTVDRKLSAQLQEVANEGFITCAFTDHTGDLWLSCIRHRLLRIDRESYQEVEIQMTQSASEVIATYTVNELIEVPECHAIYIATDGGILKFDTQSQLLSLITDNNNIPFSALLFTDDRQLLAGSDSHGLWTVDTNDKVQPYKLTEPIYDLSMAKVKDIAKDRHGNIIIALLQKGIYVIPRRTSNYHYYPISYNHDGRNTSAITSVVLDDIGRYWIATDGAGVFCSANSSLDTALPINDGLRSLQMQSLSVDKRGTVWAGSYGGGIQCLTKGSSTFVTPSWLDFMRGSAIMSMHYDSDDDFLYLATNGMGVMKLDLQNQTAEHLTYADNQGFWTVDVHVDTEGTIWVGEVNSVFYTNERTGTKGVIPHTVLPGQPICLSSLERGGHNYVLIGTTEGILIYNTEKGESKHLIPMQKIQSINATKDEIWVATPNSICTIDLDSYKTTEIRNFGGFFLGEFHRRSTLLSSQDELIWGCDNGILSFNPHTTRQPHQLYNKVLFTSLRVGGQNIAFDPQSDMLDANIFCAREVTLNYDNNTFSMTFGIPDFSESPNTSYEYYLEGYDKDWLSTSIAYLHYSSLRYRTYKLHVRACVDNTPIPETEQTILICVKAPWYATIWAKCAYVLAFLMLLYAIWKNLQIRRRREAELQQARHEDELKEAKLRLFTSITHELRSPLTMIVTPLRHLISTAEDEKLRSNLTIMQHNCNRLLNTVSQITDIRKIDAGQFQLHFEEVDICQYACDIMQGFMGTAEVRNIQFKQVNSDTSIFVWIDRTHFEKVLVNILSNAFKFTQDGGKIELSNVRKDNELEISIFNTGQHIKEGDMEHIYERFFQTSHANNIAGSGIGLNLSYELMQLHHGSLEACNVEPEGVKFILHLPLGRAHLTEDELLPNPQKVEQTDNNEEDNHRTEMLMATIDNLTHTAEGESEEGTSKALPRVLVVDDDKDLCDYLYEELHNDYHVTLAFGGSKAWDIVLKNRPDIIITDIMMPDGDGIELAQRIKSNPELDNIPIVMITGEDNDSLQLQSLQLNVDHFMQKPFNMSILKGAIKQALKVRENTRKHSQRTDFGDEYGKMEMDSVEENLYTRISKTLQEHLDDSDYGVRELSEEVGISRVHLNRKMKERYGLSPNAFIKSFRLKQAAHLLVNNRVNVSEVAYKVGFSTHSHFSSSFREFYGMSPKEFVVFYTKEENAEALKKLIE